MKENLIVDAFNLIHAAERSGRFRAFCDIKRCVYALESFACAGGSKIVLVFDGTRFRDEFRSSAHLEVLFSEGAQKADTVAESWMSRLPAKDRLGWVLVSEDGALRRMALGWGLRVERPLDFLERVLQSETAQTKSGSGAGPSSEPFNNPFYHRF